MLTRERPTIVFDIDGLANIPSLKEQVFDPLKGRKDLNVGFWSIVGKTQQKGSLDGRVAGYRSADFCIGGDIMRDIRLTLVYALKMNSDIQSTLEMDRLDADGQWARKVVQLYMNKLRRNSSKRPFNVTPEINREMGSRLFRWFNCVLQTSVTHLDDYDNYLIGQGRFDPFKKVEHLIKCLKYPPILSKQPTLLVESDYMEEPGVQDPLSRLYPDFAEMAGFSLIQTPEFVSEEQKIWREGPLSLGEFVESLKDRIMRWNGERFTADLGEELGIYPYFRAAVQ